MYGDFDGDEEQLRQRSLSTNETVLDGQRDVWHVITASGNAYLDGFVITGGDGLTAGGSANGGGIYHSGERLTVYNTRLYSNYAVNGGAIAANSDTLVISNAAMYRNYGQSKGHAIYVGSGAMAYITNCTLAYNDVSQKGLGDGTIYSDNASGEILNTIIWGNSDGELEGDQFDLDWTILYSIVENELQMNEDPLLTSDRYHLTWQSPCVDWGSDRGMYTLNHDMEGHIWSEVNVERMSAVDIGAVDYNPAY